MRSLRPLALGILSCAAPILVPSPMAQTPAPGIARDLARARAERIDGVRIDVEYRFTAGNRTVDGMSRLRFDLRDDDADPADVVLDFGTGLPLEDTVLNSLPATLDRIENHVVLPSSGLVAGTNTLEGRFAITAEPTGSPLTVYRDDVTKDEYFYSLVVPADAHRMVPCFDQPDLKTRFTLTLTTPAGWRAVANGEVVDRFDRPRERDDGELDWSFAETEPISTYLFAFAAGPFAEVKDAVPAQIGNDPSRPLKAYLRPSRVEEFEARRLFGMHREALRWLGNYFDVPYPFGKLDFVLLPGFPYGGMEHAGAIFYRESALCFDHDPTESELLRRSTLVYHEVTHQWFGNLVTMEWFDDLWLKEGFATFVSYTLLEALEPGKRAWLRFHQRVKPRAYSVDRTRGTVPIQQELRNLADAKSAYGPIVYNKAPAVLRQLQAWIGPAAFQRGMRQFLRRHAYANATWQDMVRALEAASGRDETTWSDRWILAPGLPTVRARWTVEDGRIATFVVEQSAADEDARRQGAAWPLDLEILLLDGPSAGRTGRVALSGTRAEVEGLVGEPAPRAVLLNPRDVAYGLFVLDAASAEWLCDHAPELEDPLSRAVAYAALRETVRALELAPERFADTLLRGLEDEGDPETHAWLLATTRTVVLRYLRGPASAERRARWTALLLDQMRRGALDGRELQTFRALAWAGDPEPTVGFLRALLAGEVEIEGLELGTQDRFLAASSILASTGDEGPLRQVEAEERSTDSAKYAFMAQAAHPDPERKATVFARYLETGEDQAPEQWIQDSLDFFHWPGQEEVSLPYLRPALERVDWVKRNRKIFFMPAWIDAFVNGHSSEEALGTVQAWTEDADLETDVRKKVLQSLDELELTVRIRSGAAAAGEGR